MENKHTPGPWQLETVRTSCGICHKIGPFPRSAGREVGYAFVYVDYPGNGQRELELNANAKLIATAPDLLATCKEMYRTLAGLGHVLSEATLRELEPWLVLLSTVIAKAEGPI